MACFFLDPDRGTFSVCAVWSSPPDQGPAHPHLPRPAWTITLTSPCLYHYRCQRRTTITFRPQTVLPTALIAPTLLVIVPSGPPSSNRSALRFLIMKRDSFRYRLRSYEATASQEAHSRCRQNCFCACGLGEACICGGSVTHFRLRAIWSMIFLCDPG